MKDLELKPIEIGWLVERGKTTPFYLCVKDWFGFSWTADSLKAIRFARREDAEQIMKLTESVDCKATEHQWGS